jgi:hypothetical protein
VRSCSVKVKIPYPEGAACTRLQREKGYQQIGAGKATGILLNARGLGVATTLTSITAYLVSKTD